MTASFPWARLHCCIVLISLRAGPSSHLEVLVWEERIVYSSAIFLVI